MTNRATVIENDCIEIVFDGDQTEKTVKDLLKMSDRIITKMAKPRSKLNFLINLLTIGQTTSKARLAAARALQERPFNRMGVFGTTVYMKYLATLVIAASRKQDRVRYFDDRVAAMDWICND